jgi:ATP-dependent Clp protease ATP-binding subunit ClpA
LTRRMHRSYANVGAKLIKDSGSIGFGRRSEEASYAELKTRLTQKMEEEFRPEFIARLVGMHIAQRSSQHGGS